MIVNSIGMFENLNAMDCKSLQVGSDRRKQKIRMDF